MITEDYVSYDTAKLLKEKGFDERVKSYFTDDGLEGYMFGTGRKSNSELEECFYSRPTLQMAMKWLREVHHYYIQVMLDSWACGGHMGYYVVLQRTDNDFEMMLSDAVDEVFYQTYDEACEAGIRYCLENLI